MSVFAILAAKKPDPNSVGFQAGEMIGYAILAILVVVVVVSALVVREAHKKNYVNAGLLGFVLFGSVLGPGITLQLAGAGFIEPAAWQIWFLLAGAVVWVFTLIGYAVVSSKMKREDSLREVDDLEVADTDDGSSAADAEHTGLDTVDGSEMTPVEPPPDEEAAAPRRAVSLPVAESDSSRASEQTLKRMTMDQVESASQASKAPRASEIPENPILPDGPCKVRCLDCDKKMKADGERFMRQRRCPNCKKAPFRYVTAV